MVKVRGSSVITVVGSNPTSSVRKNVAVARNGKSVSGLWAKDSRHREKPGWCGEELLRLSHDVGQSPPTLIDFPPGENLAGANRRTEFPSSKF